MKNLCLLLSFLATTTLFAQSTNFEQAIEQQLSQISVNTSQENWQTIRQSFAEIAVKHPNQWITNYYTAYAYMQLAGTYEDQTLPIVAEHLDKAQAALDKTNALMPNHSEVLVLQGFIYIARIWESPFMNGGLYGRKISKLFKAAIEIDPENPRAYYLKGLLTYHTPSFCRWWKRTGKTLVSDCPREV